MLAASTWAVFTVQVYSWSAATSDCFHLRPAYSENLVISALMSPRLFWGACLLRTTPLYRQSGELLIPWWRHVVVWQVRLIFSTCSVFELMSNPFWTFRFSGASVLLVGLKTCFCNHSGNSGHRFKDMVKGNVFIQSECQTGLFQQQPR